MRLFLLFFIGLLAATPGSGQKLNKLKPPGTVRINDTLFADITEVTNVSWREFLYSLSITNPELANTNLPDTMVWNSDSNFTSLSEFYFRHPMFNAYPVAGINYEQALAFCEWRTRAANFILYCKKNRFENPKEHLTDTFPIRFYYRLPTEKEWEMLAAGGVDSSSRLFRKYSALQQNIYNTKETVIARRATRNGHHFEEETLPANSRSFFIYKSGCYHLIGNVAEMVQEKGIAKGGSFDHMLPESEPTAVQQWSKPERWLGFRCVAVLLK